MIPIRDKESSGIFPLITISIICICGYVLFKEFTSSNIDLFISKWALIPSQLNFNDINSLIPLVTSIFLHGGLIHFLSNMLYLWIFGDNVEADLGKFGFILFYIVSGVIANIVQLMFIGSDLNIPVLGASGAIAGVLGYYAVRFPHHRTTTLVFIFFFVTFVSLPALLVLGFWFITQLLSGSAELTQTTSSSGVAIFAHIGGFIFGALIALLMTIFGVENRNKQSDY